MASPIRSLLKPALEAPVARPLPEDLPGSSLLRLYDPRTQGNSFSLDGFPALREGKEWRTRLVEFIEERGVAGMTTNQTLFRQLTEAGALDDRLRDLKAHGKSVTEIYRFLYNEAAVQAARVFSALHARWLWEGRVSQEASALLTEVDPLVAEVRRIARLMEGVGCFTKIPNLAVGAQAIRKALSEGDAVHPNITLVFSDRHYLRTVEATLTGFWHRAENLKKEGLSEAAIRKDLSRIYSVNSLFVSRVDRVVDPMIEEALRRTAHPEPTVRPSSFDRLRTIGDFGGTVESRDERLRLLKGKVAVAQAKKVAQMFEAIFLGVPFKDPEGCYADSEGIQMQEILRRLSALYADLKQRYGVNPQRLLIASSGVKSDQPYSPLLYVLPFLGPWSANTMPEGTLESLSRFVAGLSEERVAMLKKRSIMREPLPAIPTDGQPTSGWDEAVLMTAEERRGRGIAEVSPDQILRAAQDLVLEPKGTSLRAIGDTLRDKGAASFTADEQATLQAIQTKLTAL